MARNESTAINDLVHLSQGNVEGAAQRLPGMPPPMPRKRAAAATPAPIDYRDEATEIDAPHVAQKKWLDSIETIPFDPSMRVSGSDLGEGTPPRAVAPVRVEAPRPRTSGTPRPTSSRPAVRHPDDNVITRLMHVDVAGGHVSFTPDPDRRVPPPRPMPLAAPAPTPLIGLYGAPALPPHLPTAIAVPPQAIMPTQIATAIPAHVSQALPALVRPADDAVTPYPVPRWANGQPVGMQPHVAKSAVQPQYVTPANHLDIYSDSEDERSHETLRVAALPPSMTPSLRPSIGRFLVPVAGVAVLMIFVAGYFFVRGENHSGAQTGAPIVMQATATSMVAVQPAPIVTDLPAAAKVEPVVEPIAVAEPVAVEPVAAPVAAAEPVGEIEMAPMTTKKSHSSSSARRAKRVAVIELPVETKKPAKVEKTKAVKIAKSAKADRDPILEEIEKPSKAAAAKATGPGKLVVSSSIPTLIYVDGRSTNLMTPKTINLAAGTHKITLLDLKSRKAKTVDIDVASGSVAKLDKKF